MPFMVTNLYSPLAVRGGFSGLCAEDSPSTWSPCALQEVCAVWVAA